MITVNKANPTPGEITSSLTGSSGDGAGLNLQNQGYFGWTNTSDTNLGTSDFSIEFILNQTAENSQDNYIWFTNFTGNSRAYIYNDISDNVFRLVFQNSSGSSSGLNFAFSYDMSADYGTPTHYTLTVDRSGDATLYKNGNSVASETVSAASAINLGDSNTNDGRVGSSSDGYSVLGTFYRFRVFNTLVDAKLLFERADVPRTLTANLKIDLDLAFANPTQSLTIQNRAGAPDGEASSSTAVTQVQPIIQGNMRSLAVTTTSQAAGVPADGEIIAGSVTAKPTTTTGGVVIDASGQTGTTARLELKADRPSADQDACDIRFYNNNAAPIAHISAVKGSGSNDTDGKLDFYTSNTKQLTIDSSGNITQNGAQLKIERDNFAPSLDLYNNKAAPTADTVLGYASFKGKAPSGAYSSFANIGGFVESVSGVAGTNNVSGYLTFNTTDDGTVAAERMRIASTGHVSMTSSDADAQLTLTGTGTNAPAKIDLVPQGTGNARIQVGGSDKITIASTGNVQVGASVAAVSSGKLMSYFDGNTGNGLQIHDTNTGAGTGHLAAIFTRNTSVIGSISTTASATAFNTSSDYRLKENLEPLTGALDRLDQLPVYRFNFKADPETTVDGFVAHEVSAHVPEAITGEKDAMRTVVVQEAVEAVEAQPATNWEEGDELPEGVAVGDEKTAAVEAVEAVEEVTEEQPDYQGIDQSKLVPLLVAAVKELKAKVETLENA
jgi:hypothetical protein